MQKRKDGKIRKTVLLNRKLRDNIQMIYGKHNLSNVVNFVLKNERRPTFQEVPPTPTSRFYRVCPLKNG